MHFVAIFMFLFFTVDSQSEPWVANRFAKNCAGCHSPGRMNKEAKGRRCTLSCQGCHTNPNGGGLRNHYGKWTQERWLRSFNLKKHRWNKNSPAPYKQQAYAKKKNKKSDLVKDRRYKRYVNIGASQVETPNHAGNEDLYNKFEDRNWKKTATTEEEFLYFVAKEDPIREKSPITAGVDIRKFFIRQSGDNVPESREEMNGLMGVDTGLELNLWENSLSLVVEMRTLNDPKNSEWDDGFSRAAMTRSAYVLLDDLAYNSYFMAGLYRPMFSHFNPDHQSLFMDLSGIGIRSRYKVTSFGMAPNVPFFNINYIQKHAYEASDQSNGIVANFGLRFVTLGISTVLSYWDTRDELTGEETEMYALDFGIFVWRWINNTTLLRVERANNGGLNAGSMINSESKFKLWRENYLVLNYAASNVARNLEEGEASEVSYGFKFFPISGVELELLQTQRNNKEEAGTKTVDNISHLQLHFFY